MNYNVQYIDKKDYLIRKLSEDIGFQAVIDSWQYLVEHDLQKGAYQGIINDFSDEGQPSKAKYSIVTKCL